MIYIQIHLIYHIHFKNIRFHLFNMLNKINLAPFVVVLAALVQNLNAIISLVGALSSSTLALIFPPLIEIVTFGPHGLGRYYWKLWKDLAIMIFGILGFFFGSYASIIALLNPKPQAVI